MEIKLEICGLQVSFGIYIWEFIESSFGWVDFGEDVIFGNSRSKFQYPNTDVKLL